MNKFSSFYRPIFYLTVFLLAIFMVFQAKAFSSSKSVDSLKNVLNELSDADNNWIDANITVGKFYLQKHPDSAYIYLKAALNVAEVRNETNQIANCQRLLGEVFFNQGLFQQSLKHHLEAQKYYSIHNTSKQEIAENFLEIGMLYYYLRQFPKSEKSYYEALKIFESIHSLTGKANTLGKLGHMYEKKSNYPTAHYYQNEALKIYQKLNNKEGIAIILENIGSVYEDENDYKKAYDFFMESLDYNITSENHKAMISNYNNIGDIYRKKGEFKQALFYTNKTLTEAIILNDLFQISAAYKDLSKAYNLMGDYKNAYENLEKGRNIYEEIFNEEGTKQLVLMQTLYDIDKKDQEISLLEKENKYNYITRVALVIFLLLIVISGFLVVSRQRLKIRKNNQIIEQNKKLYEQEQALIKIELQNTLLKEKQLKSEIQVKTQELTSNALHLIRKNKLLEGLRVDLEVINKNGKEDTRKHVKSLIKKVDHSIIQDNEWDDFRKSFEQVHYDFMQGLRKHCTDLSTTELRLCALIKLNISSKDIAVMMGITQDSLRVARYRLRKKLLIKHGDSLTVFIQNL